MKPRRGAGGGARARKAAGATRFCMGAAWREVKDGPAFDERARDGARRARARAWRRAARWACSTTTQAQRLAEAGPDRLQPQPRHLARVLRVDHLAPAPTTIACARSRTCARPASPSARGGIIGMGESLDDRCEHAARRWPTSTRSPRACRSTRWSPVEGTPLGRSAAGRSARAGAHDRDRAHPDAARRACACRRGAWRCRARRRCSASSPAPTRSSTARSCSPPATRTSRPIRRCCATPGCARAGGA